ncbi:MAG TPA: PASTA domain-containing protein [Candidatus Bathyarchaeia archaeon]|nr:PASTA domain-containing protein [Candidatus Bathyarchaeia archaeon]
MSTSGLGSSVFRLLSLTAFALVWDAPAFADTATPSPPPAQQRIYVPPSVQVPELRQRSLSDAQKAATDVRLRVQVSGDAPADPSTVVVVDQKPAPNTSVPMGSTITVVVRPPSGLRQRLPSDAVVVQPPRTTVVPDLLRHNLIEARPLMTTARLRLEVSGGEPEDTSHAIVMEQKPPPGTHVTVGSTVVVIVQVQRTQETVVPDVRTKRLPDAQSLIASAKLRLEVSGGMPADPSRAVVVEEKPSPGTHVRAGSTVTVTVQTPPPEYVVVPELRRQLLPNAQRSTREMKLRLEVSGGSPPDPSRAIVVEQKPPEGTRVPPGSIVVVAVRSLPTPTDPPPPPLPPPTAPPHIAPPTVPPPVAPPPVDELVQVPALLQRPLMDALQRVRGARLRLDVAGGWPSDPAHAVVHGQTPAEGTRVRIGSTVTVQLTPPAQVLQPPPVAPPPPPPPPPTAVAPPPPPQPRVEQVVVPELRQHLLAEARPLVASARLELRVQGQAPADETRVVVVNQRPLPGARVAARSVVAVELAPALLAVPELRKHPLDEARQIVDRAGFELAVMGDSPSNESGAQIIEQSPLPGTRAAAGTTITVRAKASRLITWVVAGVGTLLAAGAAAGIARWRGLRGHSTAGMPGVRIVANSDIGKQEIHSNGSAVHAFALRLRSRLDAGAQTVDGNASIVTEAKRSDG